MSRPVSGSSEQNLAVTTSSLVENARSDGTNDDMQSNRLRAKTASIGIFFFLVADHLSGSVRWSAVVDSLQ